MKWNLKPRWMTEPDEEYVIRIRRQIAFWEYWRYLFLLFAIALFVAVFWIIPVAVQDLSEMIQPENAPFLGISISAGFTIGFLGGVTLLQIGLNLMLAFTGFRSDRLLLKYYDASVKSADEEKDEPEKDE